MTDTRHCGLFESSRRDNYSDPYNVTFYFAGIIASALVNKFGCRGVCIVGSFIAAGSFILCTFSPSVEVLMVTYGIMGGV